MFTEAGNRPFTREPQMSLRAKLLGLFAIFGVLPVVAVGVYGYLRSLESVRDLIRERTGAIATQLAGEIESRYALRQSDLALFSGNAETLRLFRTRAEGDSAAVEQARASAEAFLDQAWDVLGASYSAVLLRDSSGALIQQLGFGWPGASEQGVIGDEREFFTVLQPIHDPDSGRELGTVEAVVRLRTLIPGEAMSASFGAEGYSVVLDRTSGRVLHHPNRRYLSQSAAQLTGPSGWNVTPNLPDSGSGSFELTDESGRHVASFVSLAGPPWTVVSTGSVDEFAAPFARTRALDLALVGLLAATVWVGFLFVTNRLMGSLTALTRAADQVSQGDLNPPLPVPGSGEVGRLTGAFALMLRQIREMLRRIRESRHMAAVGKFASQLSHEIRNPLTAVKLNLQSLERGVESGEIDASFAEPVAISLGEVRRLEAVVKGVLSLARAAPASSGPVSVHASLESALQLLQPQLQAAGIAVETDLRATADITLGDGERLRGAFLNLLLNAVDAMPEGGRLQVTTDVIPAPSGAEVIRVRIADDGPGVPSHLREKIFEAFFSTKDGGTGFGLALALQAVEEHEGRLWLRGHSDEQRGAVFDVELPLGDSSGRASYEASTAEVSTRG
jgi:signal transduction histidine kinase